MNMTGKVVVITGASRGIGEAAAREFHAQGAKVALLARSTAAISAIADELGNGAIAISCDVSSFESLVSAVEAVKVDFGPIDVFIGNAGMIEPMMPLAETDPVAWGQTIDVNLKGVYYGMRAVLPDMVARGQGTIITISSGAAHGPVEPWSAYCASKAGAFMLTRQGHLEYGDHGIRVLGLSPGTVATQMQRDIKTSGLGPVAQLDWSDHIPPEWPAKALVWMCGTDADDYLGYDVSLRDPSIRQTVGVI